MKPCFCFVCECGKGVEKARMIQKSKKRYKKIAFGYFKLEKSKRTVEGDTLYLDFNVEKTK